MKYLRLDSVGGISGDMFLGLLMGLGADRAKLEISLRKLVPGEDFGLFLEEVRLNGLCGVRAKVVIPREGHTHRTMGDIRSILENSELPEKVKLDAVGVFSLLAEAEGSVHGMAPEKVAFHEVGALDSIVDIAGCCLAWHMLGLEALALSPLPTGSGVVRTAHGLMPIPAPATAEIFARYGLLTAPDDEPFELVTPTGAALAAYFPKCPAGAGKVVKSVNAFGRRELLSRPNLLRGMFCEADHLSEGVAGQVMQLECNLDDLSGELLGHAAEKLLAAGALDVWTVPVYMKKQRPGVILSVLCPVEDAEVFRRMIFQETSTFGIRERIVARTVLDRCFETAETSFGPVRIKCGSRNGTALTRSPEYEDCRKLAEACQVPLRTVWQEALKKL